MARRYLEERENSGETASRYLGELRRNFLPDKYVYGTKKTEYKGFGSSGVWAEQHAFQLKRPESGIYPGWVVFQQFRSDEPGPHIVIIGPQHGDEFGAAATVVELKNRLVSGLMTGELELRGTIEIITPNPWAQLRRTREAPAEMGATGFATASSNMNRLWGIGGDGAKSPLGEHVGWLLRYIKNKAKEVGNRGQKLMVVDPHSQRTDCVSIGPHWYLDAIEPVGLRKEVYGLALQTGIRFFEDDSGEDSGELSTALIKEGIVGMILETGAGSGHNSEEVENSVGAILRLFRARGLLSGGIGPVRKKLELKPLSVLESFSIEGIPADETVVVSYDDGTVKPGVEVRKGKPFVGMVCQRTDGLGVVSQICKSTRSGEIISLVTHSTAPGEEIGLVAVPVTDEERLKVYFEVLEELGMVEDKRG